MIEAINVMISIRREGGKGIEGRGMYLAVEVLVVFALGRPKAFHLILIFYLKFFCGMYEGCDMIQSK